MFLISAFSNTQQTTVYFRPDGKHVYTDIAEIIGCEPEEVVSNIKQMVQWIKDVKELMRHGS